MPAFYSNTIDQRSYLVVRILSSMAIAVGADFDELSRAASCRECAIYRAWPAASSIRPELMAEGGRVEGAPTNEGSETTIWIQST